LCYHGKGLLVASKDLMSLPRVRAAPLTVRPLDRAKASRENYAVVGSSWFWEGRDSSTIPAQQKSLQHGQGMSAACLGKVRQHPRKPLSIYASAGMGLFHTKNISLEMMSRSASRITITMRHRRNVLVASCCLSTFR
jgi:hypothetical protein